MVQSAIDQDGVAGSRPPGDQPLTSAVEALHRWRPWVRALPHIGGAQVGSRQTALRGLAAWYERLCTDDRYANPPPAEALDALDELERRRSSTNRDDLALVRWAIRVAEELARCRQALTNRSGDDGRAGSVALSRLEVALHGARLHVPDRHS